ncbi:MAG TPA: hypothetical protein PLH21_09220 [Chiayiivirga sp.]|nr:hypothetical protein [Chiayiivirga sp.]
MTRIGALSLSMLLMLAAFPLISLGTVQGPPLLWKLGLLALGVGGLIPPLGRFIGARKPEPPPTRAGLAEDERVS